MNWSYFWGTTTIVLIIGGTIYAVKKSLEQSELEEDIMTADQAQAEVQARRAREVKLNDALNSEEFEEVVNDCRDTANWNSSFVGDDEEPVTVNQVRESEGLDPIEDVEEENDDKHVDHVGELYTTEIPSTQEDEEEEDNVLRHEPSSIDARNQYIEMELADWLPGEEARKILATLFNFPFEPKNDGDEDLRLHISDYRMSFFGPSSKWINEVTFADIILHYSRSANYNYNESIKYWVEYFLDLNELHYNMSDMEIYRVIEALNNHVYFNENTGTFGLFGLTTDQMNQSINIANKNVDASVTYNIEFNEFLKGCVG